MASVLESLFKVWKQILCGGSGAQQEQQQQPRPQQQNEEQQNEEFPPLQPSGQQQQHQHNQQQHQQHHQPVHEQPKPHQPQQQHHERPPKRHRVHEAHDQNLINQRDSHYTSLRDRAHKESDEMGRCFDKAHRAHDDGDGRLAKEMSEEGHRHQRERDKLDREAAEWIFKENNLDSQPGEIDLHGLYVKEAVEYTDRSIEEAQGRGDSEIHLIVGKGLHSANHVAKLKPAIEELMVKHNLSAHLDPENSGVLIVKLTGEGGGMSADEVTRRLDSDDACVVM